MVKSNLTGAYSNPSTQTKFLMYTTHQTIEHTILKAYEIVISRLGLPYKVPWPSPDRFTCVQPLERHLLLPSWPFLIADKSQAVAMAPFSHGLPKRRNLDFLASSFQTSPTLTSNVLFHFGMSALDMFAVYRKSNPSLA